MPRFLPLSVTEVHRETRDAVTVSVKPRDEDLQAFDFIQGQYLTFRREFDGVELAAVMLQIICRFGFTRIPGTYCYCFLLI